MPKVLVPAVFEFDENVAAQMVTVPLRQVVIKVVGDMGTIQISAGGQTLEIRAKLVMIEVDEEEEEEDEAEDRGDEGPSDEF